MSDLIKKQSIARNFSRRAKIYDQNARLQLLIADELAGRCSSFSGNILDVGAGTGNIRKITGWDNLVELDLAFGMCLQNGGNIVNADMETLPFRDESFGNVISSLSLQWSVNLENALAELHRILKPGGQLGFSTFAPGSMHELKNAYAYMDEQQHLMEFMPVIKIYAILKKAGFENVAIDSQKITYTYENIYELLNSIKKIGASYPYAQNSGLKGKGHFIRLENVMRNLSSGQKLSLSWEALYITCRKN